jgi:hypothetical protein
MFFALALIKMNSAEMKKVLMYEYYGSLGHAVAYLVALCYKPEGIAFDSRCHWIFQLI